MFPGSSPNGAWIQSDWDYYYAHRIELYLNPDKWINDDLATGWKQFTLHVERLMSHYDLTDRAERDQFVQDFGLIFGGISESKGVWGGAWDSMGGPGVTYGQFENGKPIPSYLHYTNDGVPDIFLDSIHIKENQSHHYAGIFYLSYFFSPPLAQAINFGRDPTNLGDILLGNKAADDALLFSMAPDQLIYLMTYYSLP